MSLLLEALKKAELAKQGALGTPHQDEELDIGGIRFEEPSEPTLRSDQIPQYREESAFERTAENGFTPEPEPEPAPAPAPEPIPVAAPRPVRPSPPPEQDVVSPPSPNPQRTAARQMFEAKEVDYNPKRPFYITLGVLGLAAVGYGVYLWWQLQPKYSVNTATIQNAPKSSPIPKPLAPPPSEPAATTGADAAGTALTADGKPAETAPAVAPETPGQSAPAVQPAKAGTAPAAITPSGSAPPKPAPAPAAIPTPSSGAAAAPRSGRQVQSAPTPSSAASTPAAPATQSAPRAPRLPIKVTPPAFQSNQVLESAFAAFQRGELDRARNEYQQVLGREANNRDALLGLAAIDVRTRDYETAELRYLKLLELDPRDASAQAALISLQGNIDPVQTESRIKNLIATQPEATHLYFTLGNQYAAQKRWAEAQDAYFKAYSGDPENADFAFNLAISLDHLRQRRPAAEYYRKALNLAGTRVVGFDRKVAETRAKELER